MFNPSSAQDLVNAGFFGYQGWDDAGALADFKATGGSGKGSLTNPGAASGGGGDLGSGDLIGLARQSLELGREFAQPGIETLQGAIGGVKEQYAKLLETFKPQVEATATAEFGKRGIPISSTAAQEGIQKKVLGLSTNLAAQESAATTPLQVAIANLQSGQGGGGVLSNAVDLQRLGESQRQFDISSQLERDVFNRQGAASGGGGGGGIIVPPSDDDLFGDDGLPQQTVPSISTGVSTNQLSGADLFRQRVLAGNVPQGTVRTQF